MTRLHLMLTLSVFSSLYMESSCGDVESNYSGAHLRRISRTVEESCTESTCINGTCLSGGVCQCHDGYYHASDVEDSIEYICKPFCKDCWNGDCIGPEQCNCFDGYKRVDSRCEPVCNPRCVNGMCIGPNMCDCYPGFKGPNHDTNECTPDCVKECVNSICVAPNKCRCLEKYYETEDLSDRFICKPYCDDCLNGKCSAPGNCTCHEGYTRIHSRCEPVCNPKCVNGKCIGPNQCECHFGFNGPNHETNECTPDCEKECINSTCVAPNKCRCLENYYPAEDLSDRYICKPYCEDCLNGECSELGNCTCHEGYTRIHSRCEPVCNPKCVNGRCIGPNQCECLSGFKGPDHERNECTPNCVKECINSTCVAPNKCRCLENYYAAEDLSDRYICKPYCEGCLNGECTRPGNCTCHEGYTRINSRCEPVCNPKCFNGKCIGPNLCECFSGFKGPYYKRNKCTPNCEKKCINSTCVAPNKCSCLENYYPAEELSDRYICKPYCEDCLNGECTRPGNCTCHEGFKRINSRCESVCDPECVNGNCIGPNQCECYSGFKGPNRDSHECTPICEKTCVNSTCVAPNKCTCLENYFTAVDLSDRYICKPHCEDCLNGECTGPSHCTCHEGYTRIESRCEPVCKENCVNGYCFSPNLCKCYEGFYRSTAGDCEPICGQECINSSCIAPFECKCWEGYTNIEDSSTSYKCTPHCLKGCSHGDCIEPNVCKCHDGYSLSPDDKTLCLPNCSVECINGVCEAPNKCSCKSGTWKSSASRCSLKCSVFPKDEECYHGSRFSQVSLKHTWKESNTSLELLDASDVHGQIPFVQSQTNEIHPSVVNFMCFTNLRPEGFADIVCSFAKDKIHDQPINKGVWPVGLEMPSLITADLVFLYRTTSELRAARVCSDSNRLFIINGLSELSMCVDVKQNPNEVQKEESGFPAFIVKYASTRNIVLFFALVAIVAASSFLCIIYKCRYRKKTYHTCEPQEYSYQIPLEDQKYY